MPDPIPDPSPIPLPAPEEPPPGSVYAPKPTAAGQIMVSILDDGDYTWSLLNPPEFPDDQPLHYGTNGPYWKNAVGGCKD